MMGVKCRVQLYDYASRTEEDGKGGRGVMQKEDSRGAENRINLMARYLVVVVM